MKPMRLLPMLLLVIHAHAADPAPRIERVEPAFWWQGFEQTGLQLLVYGDRVSGLAPAVDHPGIRIDRIERVDSPNYLFVYLKIDPEAQPGRFDIVFSGSGTPISHPYRLLAKNPDPAHASGFSPADAIYLITPDRYANGDPGNDDVEGYADEADRDALGGRHGGDIQGIIDHLDYIDAMGFTAIWLNPVLENAMPEYSYHGYSTTDFYRVDPRFGSNEDYRRLVRTAKERGIGVIMDMIVNHIGNRHWWMDDLPTDDWLNHQGDPRITSHEHMTVQDPYASKADRRAFADGWFVPTMPDLNQRNPLLADYLLQNALWWIEYLGLSGIRMDTYPYPDKEYMASWTRRIMREYPAFNIVGEEWSLSQPTVAYWQRGKTNHDGYRSWLPSLMDFPLRHALQASLTDTGASHEPGWLPLYRTLANDHVYADPNALVVFADNHDMSRVYTQLGENFELYRQAMVYVLTMRGTPQIYYGTEILMTNPGSDDHGLIRSDFPGGWPDDRNSAFSGRGLSPEEARAQALLKKLLNWRRSKPVIHHGDVLHYVPHDGVYVYFRFDPDDRVMVLMNGERRTKSVAAERYAEGVDGRTTATDVITDERVSLEEDIPLAPHGVRLLELHGR